MAIFTMPSSRSFVEMYNKGLIYRGKRLVNWDPHFETAELFRSGSRRISKLMAICAFKYPLRGWATLSVMSRRTRTGKCHRSSEERDYIIHWPHAPRKTMLWRWGGLRFIHRMNAMRNRWKIV